MAVLNFLKKLWAAWKRVGQFIGDIVGRIVLTALYFTVVLPFGIGSRLTSDPLQLKPTQAASYWHERPAQPVSLEEARRQ